MMTEEATDFRIRTLEDRVLKIESAGQSVQIAVLQNQVALLMSELRSLRRGFYSFAFSTVGAAIIFFITSLQLKV